MALFGQVWDALDSFGQEAGKHIGGVAADTWKHLDGFGQEASKHIGDATVEAWKHLDGFGQEEAGKSIGCAVGQTRKHFDVFTQEAGKNSAGAAEHAWNWIAEHPRETFTIVSSVFAAPVAIAVTPLVLGAVGFTSGGVAAGFFAAAAHAGIGNVAAGSAFAVLQSAGAGGAGLAVVNSIVGTCATSRAVGATTPALVKEAKKGNGNDEEGTKVKEGKDQGDEDV
ncbi:hypothetical protein BU23DRAFT_525848 [Bimuria novae-zelandiae CBS 107.79]|uniref:Uncharacterized protein n=1 Tax=Bimuria novae-zelandiae CBS 107.79 TaxID=1447943 RepID=A0A6A5VMN6_9PLEO|nr:hypothetical protein BU23DRAFT_525848 [Bimuria novae-zelandiae CBS 107.79]